MLFQWMFLFSLCAINEIWTEPSPEDVHLHLHLDDAGATPEIGSDYSEDQPPPENEGAPENELGQPGPENEKRLEVEQSKASGAESSRRHSCRYKCTSKKRGYCEVEWKNYAHCYVRKSKYHYARRDTRGCDREIPRHCRNCHEELRRKGDYSCNNPYGWSRWGRPTTRSPWRPRPRPRPWSNNNDKEFKCNYECLSGGSCQVRFTYSYGNRGRGR